jgi:hypothetical protein
MFLFHEEAIMRVEISTNSSVSRGFPAGFPRVDPHLELTTNMVAAAVVGAINK